MRLPLPGMALSLAAVFALSISAAGDRHHIRPARHDARTHAGTDTVVSKEVREMVGVLDNIINPPETFDGINRRIRIDSLSVADSLSRYSGLTEYDFRQVADELGVEVAVIKAVVAIEAGREMKGFWAP